MRDMQDLAQSAGSTAGWRQSWIGPLGAITLLHAGFLFALQNGSNDPSPPTGPKELFATFITPESPTAVSTPAPQPVLPKPRKAPAPPQAKRAAAIDTAPAPHAVSASTQQVAAPDPSSAQQPAAPAVSAAAVAAAPAEPAQPKLISSGVEYLQPPQPRYPPLSRRMGEEGRTILRVLVNRQGMPEQAEIRTSSGSARLDQAAREAVMRAQFRPHIDNGLAVAVFVIVPIQFQLNH